MTPEWTRNFDLTDHARPGWLTLSLAIFAVAAFLTLHPFMGIVHDGVLYAAQALRYENPAILGQDLFFVYGSQDRFTIFSPLYGSLTGLLGLDAATRLIMALGQAVWLLCAFALVRVVVPRNFIWLTMLFVATFPSDYGGLGVFHVAEPFVTPRIFSEALGLAALAAFLRARPVLCSTLLVVAALLHPLMAAAPAGAIIITSLFRGRQPWVAVAAMAGAAAVLLLGIMAAQALQLPVPATIDAEWRDWVYRINTQLFVGEWGADNWLAIANNALLVALGCVVCPPALRSLFMTILGLAAISLVTSFMGFDMAGTLLLGQVQAWRSLWLLTVLAPICIALVIADATSRPAPLRNAVLLFGYTLPISFALVTWVDLPALALAPTLALAALCMFSRIPETDVSRSALLRKIAYFLFALSFTANIGKSLITAIPSMTTWHDGITSVMPVAILAMGIGLFLAGSQRIRGWAVLLSAVALGISLFLWDGRNDWQRYVESEPGIAEALSPPLSTDVSVFWPLNLTGVWFGMERQSYFAVQQASGLIFHRETAAEFYRRYQVVNALHPPFDWHSVRDQAVLDKALARPVTAAEITAICQAADGPDVIVLKKNIPELRPGAWRAPLGMDHEAAKSSASPPAGEDPGPRRNRDVYVYRCADVRAQSGAAASD